VTDGPVYRDRNRLGHRDIFEFKYAYQIGKRCYVETKEFDKIYGYGRSVTLFLKGRAYVPEYV